MPKQVAPMAWGAQRWLALLDDLGPDEQSALRRGRNLVRDNKITHAQVGAGIIEIQSPGSYWLSATTTVAMEPLADEVWEAIFAGMTAEASIVAKLFAGELPPQIEAIFAQAGAALFPTTRADLASSCDCLEFDEPCRHLIALHTFFAGHLEQNPFLILLFRGRTQEEVTEELRLRWAAADGETTDDNAANDTGARAPLRPSTFFTAGPALDHFTVAPEEPLTQMALLKRLGRPPFATEQEDPSVVLAQIYELTTMRSLQALGRLSKWAKRKSE